MVIKNILDGVWLHKGQEYHRFLQFSSKVQVACRGRIHEFHKKTHEIYGPLTPYHKPKLVKFGQIVFKKNIKRMKCFSKTHIMHDDGGKTRYTDFDLFKDYQQMFSTLLKKQVCVWILFS